MLGSLFSQAFKHIPRNSALYSVAKRGYYTPQLRRNFVPNPDRISEADFVDPKISELSKYIINFNEEEGKFVFRNTHFDKEMLPVLNQFKKLGLNEIQLKFLMRRKPLMFRTAKSDDKNDIIKLSQYVQDKWQLKDSQIRSLILRNPWIINLTNEQLEAKTNYFKEKLGMTFKELRHLLIIYPKTFNMDNTELDRKIEVFDNYIQIPHRTLGIIAARFPFLLNIKTEDLMANLKLLVSKQFSKAQIITIIKKHAEALAVKPGSLVHVFDIPRKAQLHGAKLAKAFTDNPRLLTICPTAIMPKKIKLLRKYELSLSFIAFLMHNYPRIFVKSLGSLELKLKYLTQRMKINLRNEPAFPTILNFSYAYVIRPRGEMMLKTNSVYPWKEVLEITDQEFCDKIGCTLEQLNETKTEYTENNNELDYKLRFFSRYVHNHGARSNY